uniref:Uncharacterized protein n=1 Tax=Romanomermis culicivorax TaxID=13658 RepID=A0A915KUJ4_ROMCU
MLLEKLFSSFNSEKKLPNDIVAKRPIDKATRRKKHSVLELPIAPSLNTFPSLHWWIVCVACQPVYSAPHTEPKPGGHHPHSCRPIIREPLNPSPRTESL